MKIQIKYFYKLFRKQFWEKSLYTKISYIGYLIFFFKFFSVKKKNKEETEKEEMKEMKEMKEKIKNLEEQIINIKKENKEKTENLSKEYQENLKFYKEKYEELKQSKNQKNNDFLNLLISTLQIPGKKINQISSNITQSKNEINNFFMLVHQIYMDFKSSIQIIKTCKIDDNYWENVKQTSLFFVSSYFLFVGWSYDQKIKNKKSEFLIQIQILILKELLKQNRSIPNPSELKSIECFKEIKNLLK
jgi:hypothetical protein